MFAGSEGLTILGDCLPIAAPQGARNTRRSLGEKTSLGQLRRHTGLLTYYHHFTVCPVDASAGSTSPGRFGL